jgi:hypothetical protein
MLRKGEYAIHVHARTPGGGGGGGGEDARRGRSSVAALTIAPCFAERSRYGTRTPNGLTTFATGALTTSGSDHVKAAIF